MTLLKSDLKRGMIIGLTGGMACGKSTVAKTLSEKGAFVIDLDRIGHELLESGSPLISILRSTFGDGIFDLDGNVSREKLGKIVFADEIELKKLNAIMHPEILGRSRKMANEFAESDPKSVVVIDSPLLIEVNAQHTVDLVLVVVADRRTQIDRIIERSRRRGKTIDEASAIMRIDAQMPLSEKIRFADFVIENSGTLSELRRAVDLFWIEIFENC